MRRSTRYAASSHKNKALKAHLLRYAYYRHCQKYLSSSPTKIEPTGFSVLAPLAPLMQTAQAGVRKIINWPVPSLRRRRGRPKKLVKVVQKWSVVQLVSDIAWSFFLTFRYHALRFLVIVVLNGLFFYGTNQLYTQVFKDLPSPLDLSKGQPPLTTKILSRDGEVLYKIYEEENRTLLPLSEIPPHVIYATIAIEDQDFYHHHGFSIRGILRAINSNIKGESLQGGSTLTQQLIKIRLLTSERTFSRKMKELLLAVLVEREYSKEQILEMYLNQVAYGGSAYGIEEAAQKYFGKSARELYLAEAAMLAGLPAAPSVYNPFGPNPELAYHRQEEVLRRMVEEGYITLDDAQRAKAQELAFKDDAVPIQAPHFVMYVRQLLAEEYGEEALNRGGLEITTTLDLELQNQTQQLMAEEIEQLKRLNINNSAGLITKPTTGEVVAMVGGVNYFDFEHGGQVNVTLRPRQPGSSIKPLTYALAMENGSTPASIIDDSPITFPTVGGPPYSPKNYDNRFHGRVTLRQALGSSYNIPAVKTLNSLGVDNLIDKGEAMGITTWEDRQRFGLSLTLGGGEVLMTDMAVMYGAFANGGKKVPLNPILEVKNAQGVILYRNQCALDGTNCDFAQVLSPGVAFLITNILSDNQARTPAFGPFSVLHIPGQEVAVKTGTTNSMKDNWTFGYTSEYLAAVWVGNNNGEPMSHVASGVTGASSIWNKVMKLVLDPEHPHAFVQPESVVKTATCTRVTNPTCANCVQRKEEYYVVGTQPSDSCNRSLGSATQVTPVKKPSRDQILTGASF